MAFTPIAKSSSFFNPTLYTGNGTVDTALTTGTFQPDLTWFKNRGTTESHMWMDAVRGATKYIQSNSTAQQGTSADKISAFTSTGVTLGSGAETNENSQPLVCYAWKANGSGSSNSDGSITSTVSVDTTSGFSIVEWTGTEAAATVGHGLGAIPKMIIVKAIDDSGGTDWIVYHHSLGNTKNVRLNTSDAEDTNANAWNSTTPTSSVFSVGNFNDTNRSGGKLIAYCFAEVSGFSSFNKYIGNGNSNGAYIYTGFKPSFIMIKRSNDAANWVMKTKKFPTFGTAGYNQNNKYLYANLTNAEAAGSALDFLSNGFKWRIDGANQNGSGDSYVYMAFGQSIVSTNNDIATAF